MFLAIGCSNVATVGGGCNGADGEGGRGGQQWGGGATARWGIGGNSGEGSTVGMSSSSLPPFTP